MALFIFYMELKREKIYAVPNKFILKKGSKNADLEINVWVFRNRVQYNIYVDYEGGLVIILRDPR